LSAWRTAASRALLARRRRPPGLGRCLALGFVELVELVGDVSTEVRGGGVDEDDVAGQVQQVGRAVEDPLGDLGERLQQEVHRRVAGVLAEAQTRADRDALVHPSTGGQLGERLEAAVGDEREQHPLDERRLEAPARGHGGERLGDAEAGPHLVEHVGAAEAARVEDLDLAVARCSGAGDGQAVAAVGLEESADRGDEASERLTVELVGTAEVVDHFGDRAAGVGASLVVGELEVRDDRAVFVLPPRLAQVYAYRCYYCSQLTTGISPLVVCLQLSAILGPPSRRYLGDRGRPENAYELRKSGWSQ